MAPVLIAFAISTIFSEPAGALLTKLARISEKTTPAIPTSAQISGNK
jgi:hypothetical protein